MNLFFSINTRLRKVRSIDNGEEKKLYQLYRDKQHTSYKYYRKFDDCTYKTLMKRELRRAISQDDDVVKFSNRKVGAKYWD